MLPILISLAVGLAAGGLTPASAPVARVAGQLVTLLVYLVVFSQGAMLGSSDGFASRWDSVLIHALALSLAVCIPTVLAVELVARFTQRRSATERTVSGGSVVEALKGVAPGASLLVAGVLLGVALGDRLDGVRPHGAWPLWILLVAIGFELGLNFGEVARRLRRAAAALWVGPLTLVVGVLGALAVSPLLPYTPAAMAAGAAGMGFYSATGPMVTGLDGPVSGGVVFLANMLREVYAIVATVPLARLGLSVEAAASLGGAVAMDSSLPFLSRGYGARGAVTGLGTGLVLSVAVPIVVPAVYELVHALTR